MGGANHFYEKWGECRCSWEILREVEMTLHYFGVSVVNLWSFWGSTLPCPLRLGLCMQNGGTLLFQKILRAARAFHLFFTKYLQQVI